MRLFIIGNGFDLAHKMNTSYNDFSKFLKKNYDIKEEITVPYSLVQIDHNGEHIVNIYKTAKYLYALINRTNGGDWSNFEENLGSLDFEEDFSFLSHVYDKNGDINLFHESANNEDLANDLYVIVPTIKDFFREWITLVNDKVTKYKPLNSFIELLDSNDGEDIFLTFNYTNTLEKLYNVNNICHIHGNVAKDKDIIIGHGKDDLFFENEDRLSRYMGCEYGLQKLQVALKKDTNSVINKHKKFFDKISSNITKIYSFGFSYGNIDLPYIEKIIKKLNPQNSNSINWYFENYKPMEVTKYKNIITSCGFIGEMSTCSCQK